MRFSKTRACLVVLHAVTSVGCTTGWIRFQSLDAGAASGPRPPHAFVSDVIDCQDYESGSHHTPGELQFSNPFRSHPRPPLMYYAVCSKDGRGIPGRVLGVYQAAPIALDNWDAYTRRVIEKGRDQGCPAVLVRRTPAFYSVEAEAIGALCVDPAQRAKNEGPLRFVAYSNEPLRLLRDDESDPRNP